MGFLCICVCLTLLIVLSDSQICPVQEGREITLNCTVLYRNNTLSKQFYWNKRVNGVTSSVASCEADYGSCTPTPSTLPYTCTVTNINALSATSYITIHSTARTDQGLWFCAGSSLTQDVEACDLKVFASPTTVSCSQPKLDNDNVIVTCTGDRVYPQPLCQFTWIKNGVEQSTYNVTVKNQTLSQSQNTDYFYPECTWTIPVQTLGFGSHQFYVLIYPNVTGNTTDMSFGRNSLTSPVEINRPEVVMESCPQDYIKEGTTVSCTCREKNNSFLKANVNWSVSPGSSIVITNQTFTTLTFTAQRNGSNYTCRAEVLQVWSESKTFVPQVAYGPDRVITKVQINGVDKTDIDLCGKPPTSQTMTVSCTVSDVRPSVTVKYFINGNVQSDGSAGSVDYTVTRGGTLLVKCTANNNQFPDIYKENATSLLVREPPNTPFLKAEQLNLISSTTKDKQLTVREGLVKISCQVDGGYQTVTQLALNCDSATNTATANTVSVQMNVTRKMNSQPCSCTATHPSTCYMNNSTTSTLNVLYPPSITNFTVLSEVVQDNTNVMFSCKAEGNPAPSLTLLRDSGSQILRQTDTNNKADLELNKNMACQDSDIYVCKAQSSEGEGREKIKIYVLCKQQLGSMESQDKVYNMKANKTFNINITVIGYPEPQQLSLHSSKELLKNEYSLTYYNTTPGKGVINLKIHTLLEDYYQKYNLNIENSQGSFVYSFEIKAENVQETDGPGSDVGAIVGGIVAGIVAFVLVAVVVFIARRKGLFNKCIKKESSLVFKPSADYEENALPIPEYGTSLSLNGSKVEGQATDLHYINTNQTASPYMNIDDSQQVTTTSPYASIDDNNPLDTADISYMNDVPNKDTQTHSPYEEISTISANASSSTTTNLREDQPYANETSGSAGTSDYVNQGHQGSQAWTRDQGHPGSHAGTSDYVNQGHQGSHSGVVQYENFLPPL